VEGHRGGRLGGLTVDRAAGLGLVAVGVFVLWECRVLPVGTLRVPGPALVPVALGLLVLGFGALIVARGAGAPPLASAGWAEWRHAAAIVGACAFAALGLERLGYRLTLGLALVFLVAVVERRGLAPALVFAAILAGGSFALFDTLLRVPLPRGPLGF
jgi:putative tricarboxylic transport membrane protein